MSPGKSKIQAKEKCEAFKAENVNIECYEYNGDSTSDEEANYPSINSCRGKLLLQMVVYSIIKKNKMIILVFSKNV